MPKTVERHWFQLITGMLLLVMLGTLVALAEAADVWRPKPYAAGDTTRKSAQLRIPITETCDSAASFKSLTGAVEYRHVLLDNGLHAYVECELKAATGSILASGVPLSFDNGLELATDLPPLGQENHPLYKQTINGAGTLERSTTHAREGGFALHERLVRNGTVNYRQELRVRLATDNIAQANSHDYWLGISTYVPASSSLKASSVLFQWHTVKSDDGQNASPVIGIRIENGTWGLTREVGTRTGATMGPVATDAWTDWVVHVRWRANNTGLIEVWKDDVLVVGGAGWTNIQTGSTADWQMPYLKLGRYTSAWKWMKLTEEPNGTVHESWHDALRVCYEAACVYDDVAPQGDRSAAR